MPGHNAVEADEETRRRDGRGGTPKEDEIRAGLEASGRPHILYRHLGGSIAMLMTLALKVVSDWRRPQNPYLKDSGRASLPSQMHST